MSEKKYSDWIKFDLHIHTNKSRETKNNDYKGDFSVDVLKEKLKSNDVEIFSLTDHNIINVEAYREYYENAIEEDPLLLLGVELDIILDNREDKKNYHTILVYNIDNIQGVNRVNEKLERHYESKDISSKKERKITIGELSDIFSDEQFFFIPHSYGHKNILDANKNNIKATQQMVLLMESAFEKVPEKRRKRYDEGFDKVLNSSFRGRSDNAYIECSDNHKISCYPCRHMGDIGDHDHYYFKGKKSYETIRLAFIDPKSRIMSPEEFGEIDRTLNYIEGIHIIKNGIVSETQLTFSPHLNVFIGGRSSGKSLLMYLIGEKIDSIQTGREDNYKEAVNKDKVTIKTQNMDTYNNIASIKPDPLYINQGDIVKYFEEKSLSELAKKSGKGNEYKNILDIFIKHSNELDATLTSVITCYANAHENVQKKFILHKAEVEDYFNNDYIIEFSESIVENILTQSKNNDETLNIVNDLGLLIGNLEAQKEMLSFSSGDISSIDKFKEFLKKNQIILSKNKKNNYKKIEFVKTTRNVVNDAIERQNESSRRRTKAKGSRDNIITKVGEQLKILHDLKLKCDILENYQYDIQEIISLSEQIDLVLKVNKNDNIKEVLLDGLNESMKDETLYTNMLSLLYGCQLIKYHRTNSPEDLKKKFISLFADILKSIKEPVDFLSYSDNDNSMNKSPGFNSEKYLEIILNSDEQKVVFIDQPEDNLGNSFISHTLVDMIREMKFKKQIFLVTHNPSIVVYGDAENIILAENKENIIKYKQLTLEDKEAQSEICETLDGGNYIFYNRYKKYNIERILKKEEDNNV